MTWAKPGTALKRRSRAKRAFLYLKMLKLPRDVPYPFAALHSSDEYGKLYDFIGVEEQKDERNGKSPVKACEVAEGDGEEPERADVERGCEYRVAAGAENAYDRGRGVGLREDGEALNQEKHGCEVLRFRGDSVQRNEKVISDEQEKRPGDEPHGDARKQNRIRVGLDEVPVFAGAEEVSDDRGACARYSEDDDERYLLRRGDDA